MTNEQLKAELIKFEAYFHIPSYIEYNEVRNRYMLSFENMTDENLQILNIYNDKWKTWQIAVCPLVDEITDFKTSIQSLIEEGCEAADTITELRATNEKYKYALEQLISAKDYKELFGKDVTYESMKTNAWNDAYEAMKGQSNDSVAEK